MRLGIVVDTSSWERAVRDVEDARDAGLDAVWLPAENHDGSASSAPVVATALASLPHLPTVVVEVAAGTHPIGLAEELAVADQALGGRVVGVLRGDDPSLLEETLQVLRAGLRSRPFRHDGERWTLPSDPAGTVVVTPPPSQLRLPLWLRGAGLDELAETAGIVLVDAGGQPPRAVADDARPAAFTAPITADGALDATALLATLLDARDRRGVDVGFVVLDPALEGPGRSAAIRRLGGRVRPQLQFGGLPEELVASWDEDPGFDLDGPR